MKYKFLFLLLSFVFLFSSAALIQSSTGNCAAKKPKMNVRKLTLTKNDEYTLRVYNLKKKQSVKFVSDNDAIVSVSVKNQKSRNASILAAGVGSTTVRANIYNKKGNLVRTLKTNVRVTPFAISIKFTQKKVKLNMSDIAKLFVSIKPNTSQEVPIFESSNTDIVTVNSKGIITAIAPGEAVITATLLSSGQKATCQILVLPDENAEASVPASDDASEKKRQSKED